ncbi:hypothetical protein Fcan01_25234 [Folsomia candida]|uniref:Uncharacterized protein n=1 Tax=Folsomia candida TaxID=158441 RepID=A0A226D2Y5_FOLCA|nr:hypothetical protein Fcan01_25234 [Folsomia candida]
MPLRKIFVSNSMVISLVLSDQEHLKKKPENLYRHNSHIDRTPFYYIFIILASPGQRFALCLPKLILNPSKWFGCISEMFLQESNFLKLVENLGVEWEEWHFNVENEVNMASTKLLPWTRRVSAQKLILDIVSMRNVSFAEFDITRHEHELQRWGSASLTESNFMAELEWDIIITENEGFQFLTCYTEPYISFNLYITPFQTELWVVLGLSITTIITVTAIVLHYRKEEQYFSIWLFILATLFEETGFIPSKIVKCDYFRLSLGTWCLMSVILTNVYNGLMISELNAPRKMFHPEIFFHLRCQNLFEDLVKFKMRHGKTNTSDLKKTKGYAKHMLRLNALNKFHKEVTDVFTFAKWESLAYDIDHTKVDNRCYKLLSGFAGNPRMPEFLYYLLKLIVVISQTPYVHVKTIAPLNLYNANHSYHPRGFSYRRSYNATYTELRGSIEQEVVQCGRTVFLAKTSELQTEYDFLVGRYPRTKFFKSTEQINTFSTGWSFLYPRKSVVVKGCKSINEAGILTFAEKWKPYQINVSRTPVMEQSKSVKLLKIATLEGAFLTLFIVTGGLICTTIFVFIVELRKRISLLIITSFLECISGGCNRGE